ncbi:MAG: outer membrane beta-barrel protein [Betaproteobacteria bacterium]|nr:outer membrane beta-barrel protein [Betaproteobacteria bacterium]
MTTQFLDLGFTSAQTDNDTRGDAWRAFGGYQLHRYVALEAGWTDLGRFGFRSSVTPAGSLEERFSVKGFDAGVVGRWPVTEHIHLLARAGVFRAERKASFAATGSVDLLAGTVNMRTQKSSKSTFGAGADVDLTPHFTVRGEWARYRGLGDDLLQGSSNIDTYTIGLIYRF